MDGRLDVAEFLAGYLAEVDDHLSAANHNLLAADESERRGDVNPGAVRELFRSLHTIKGLSGMVGVEPIVDLSHAMESVLRDRQRGGGRLGVATIQALAEGLRGIAERVRSVADRKPVAAPPEQLLAALRAEGGGGAGGVDPGAAAPALVIPPDIDGRLNPIDREQLAAGVRQGRRAVAFDFVPSSERAARGVTITSVRDRVARLGELVKVIPRSRPDSLPAGLAFTLVMITAASDEDLATAAESGDPAAVLTLGVPQAAAPEPVAVEGWSQGLDTPEAQLGTQRGVVRVEVSRLDDALDKLSALVVTRFRLGRALTDLRRRMGDAEGADFRALTDIVREQGRQLRDLRASIMKTRMIPVAELLERLPLLVRGLGASTGKRVGLEIEAGRAEVDKAVGERLFPAIVHLIRNAVDHALETPAERARAGKPEIGLIRVSCHDRASNQLELAVSDDGRGVDREAVARRAGRPVPTSDGALLDLLAIPGLSTFERPTTTSGRGVGMDVVRRIVVDELGGELVLGTERGRGSTFTMRVPLTITIQDAFAFRCGPQPFVVPVSMVEEVVEIDPGRVLSSAGFGAARAAGISVIERRGEAMPLIDLDHLLSIAPARAALRKAIVVRRAGEACAFEVDQMLGQQEVVVRPVDDPRVKVAGVAGSTDLGDGRPTLVLDLLSLAAALGRRRAEEMV